MTYKILGSSSKGNSVIYENQIMVDCGVKVRDVEGVKVKLLLLTHEHRDHFNLPAIKKLIKNNPTIRIAYCEWMSDLVKELNHDHTDLLELNKLYDYGLIKVSPFQLYHDVKQCGWRIFINDKKIFHATDTHTLEGINAKDYDLYAIEHNYDEELVHAAIEKSKHTGEFCRAYQSIDSHLSYQQAKAFYDDNRKPSSQLIPLHQSSTYGYGYD